MSSSISFFIDVSNFNRPAWAVGSIFTSDVMEQSGKQVQLSTYILRYYKDLLDNTTDKLNSTIETINISVIQVRMDQGLVVKVRCPMITVLPYGG